VNEQGRTKTFLEKDGTVRRRRVDVLEDAPRLCHGWLMGDLDEHSRVVVGKKKCVETERGI